MRWIALAVVLATIATTAPGIATAQQTQKVYRVGVLTPSLQPSGSPFFERLRELGWVEGQDFVVEQRPYADRYDRVPDLTAELVRTGVDVFIVGGAADAIRVRLVTTTLPVVALSAGDLVEMGLATSLAKPGGNVTGVQTLQPELASKHMSQLKDVVPRLSRVGVLIHQTGTTMVPSDAAVVREAEAGGRALGVAIQVATVHTPDDLAGAFASFHAERAHSIVIVRDSFVATHVKTIVDLALKQRLPTISDLTTFAGQGGLITYGINMRDANRSAADIVDKIRRGAKAGDVPIQQASTFRLVINMKTAKAVGLTIPQSLLVRADEIIQ